MSPGTPDELDRIASSYLRECRPVDFTNLEVSTHLAVADGITRDGSQRLSQVRT